MPTLSSMNLPAPKSWKEFQDITLSALRIKWSTTSLTPNGRDGQPQQGVDIYGYDDLGRFAGVQCKLTDKDEINKNLILDEIKRAEGTYPKPKGGYYSPFKPPLNVFYIATSAPPDAKIQQEIRLISMDRVVNGKFPVGIFFWDDLIQELVKNEAEFHKHYPQISLVSQEIENQRARLISLLDIGFYGSNTSFYAVEIGMEHHEILKFTSILESCASILFDSEKCSELSNLNKQLIDILHNPQYPAEIKQLTQSIEQKILNLQYLIKDNETSIFFIALNLAKWDQIIVTGNELPKNNIDDLLKMLEKFADEQTMIQVHKKTENYSQSSDKSSSVHIHLPNAVRAIIKKMIYSGFFEINRT